MNEYELVIILQPSADEARQTAIKDRVTEYVTSAGGEVVNVRDWGSRPLAFPVRKFTVGFYLVMRLRVTPDAIAELQRTLRYIEDVIRFTIVRAEATPQPA